MNQNAEPIPDDVPPTAVLTAVGGLAVASEQASLVRLALSCGLLSHCDEWITIGELAAALNAPETAVGRVSDALVALGALEHKHDRVRLSADWTPAVRDGLDAMLRQTLDGTAVRRRLIEEALSEPARYAERDAAERRALAESVTVRPTTAFGRAAAAGIIADGPPEAAATLQAGARWLELGCGVAGMLLSTASLYPNLCGVGLDVAADLLEIARQRAAELGLDDRIRFVECDARAYVDDQPFDIVFWSQYFFPADTRQAALQNAFARLRPGGLLLSPVLSGDLEAVGSTSPVAQQATLEAIIVAQSGTPVMTGDELVKEVAAAGFADARVHRGSPATTLIARRP